MQRRGTNPTLLTFADGSTREIKPGSGLISVTTPDNTADDKYLTIECKNQNTRILYKYKAIQKIVDNKAALSTICGEQNLHRFCKLTDDLKQIKDRNVCPLPNQ